MSVMCWASEQAGRRLPRTYIWATLVCMAGGCTGAARADEGIDAWASWALAPKVWKGQTVQAPELEPRPEADMLHLHSRELPLVLHVPLRSSQRRAAQTLQALERAYVSLNAAGWPLPPLDADGGVDLFVVPRARCAGFASCSGVDGPLTPSDFDAARSYALLASDVPQGELAACVYSALAQAGLRAVDPAESASWVRASAELAVWQQTAGPGCEDSLARGQAQPELGLLSERPGTGDAGALFLAVLSERTAPELVRNLWDTTRQRSRGLVPEDRLRSSPDLWEVLRQTLDVGHIALDDELIEGAVARYFAGPSARRAGAAYRVLAALPSDAAVPLAHDVSLRGGSLHLREHAPLEPLGSAYSRVRLPASESTPERLQVWLRGELGARWSLTAVRLDRSGRELGRTSAPARNVPNSYLPVTLDPETAEVILVVTQLPEQLPDADVRQTAEHGYELILESGP